MQCTGKWVEIDAFVSGLGCPSSLALLFLGLSESPCLEDMLPQASASVADESITEGTLPDEPGVQVISRPESVSADAGSATLPFLGIIRFNRLELIDPLADCAVFGDANLSFVAG